MEWIAEFIFMSIWQDIVLAAYRKWGFAAAAATLLGPIALFIVLIWLVFGSR